MPLSDHAKLIQVFPFFTEVTQRSQSWYPRHRVREYVYMVMSMNVQRAGVLCNPWEYWSVSLQSCLGR